jgi:hypothetical protein
MRLKAGLLLLLLLAVAVSSAVATDRRSDGGLITPTGGEPVLSGSNSVAQRASGAVAPRAAALSPVICPGLLTPHKWCF